MPTIAAIHSVGDCIANFPQPSYPADPHQRFPCGFRLAAGAELASEEVRAWLREHSREAD